MYNDITMTVYIVSFLSRLMWLLYLLLYSYIFTHVCFIMNKGTLCNLTQSCLKYNIGVLNEGNKSTVTGEDESIASNTVGDSLTVRLPGCQITLRFDTTFFDTDLIKYT